MLCHAANLLEALETRAISINRMLVVCFQEGVSSGNREMNHKFETYVQEPLRRFVNLAMFIYCRSAFSRPVSTYPLIVRFLGPCHRSCYCGGIYVHGRPRLILTPAILHVSILPGPRNVSLVIRTSLGKPLRRQIKVSLSLDTSFSAIPPVIPVTALSHTPWFVRDGHRSHHWRGR